jgi:putative transposase
LPRHKAEYIEAIHHVSHQIYQRPLWGQAHISFNGKFRDECLSVEWFRTRREAQVIIETWRQHYNAVRPHSSIDYLTPHEFKRHHRTIHDHPNRAISQE